MPVSDWTWPCDTRGMTEPNPVLARVAGLVMILGLVFLIVGNDPVVDDVFGTSDVDERLQAIVVAPDAWDRAWLWFAISVVPVALGFIVWAVAVARGESAATSVRLAVAGAAASVAGSLIWVFVCYARATDPPEEVAEDPNIAWWTSAFVPLVMLGLVLLGIVLRRVGMNKRGWTVVVIAVVSVPICLILPLLVPIVIAIVGVLLVATRSTDWDLQTAA